MEHVPCAVASFICWNRFLEKRDGEGKTFLNTLGKARLWMERYSGMMNPSLSSLFQVFDPPLNVPYFTNLPNPHRLLLAGTSGWAMEIGRPMSMFELIESLLRLLSSNPIESGNLMSLLKFCIKFFQRPDKIIESEACKNMFSLFLFGVLW